MKNSPDSNGMPKRKDNKVGLGIGMDSGTFHDDEAPNLSLLISLNSLCCFSRLSSCTNQLQKPQKQHKPQKPLILFFLVRKVFVFYIFNVVFNSSFYVGIKV